MMPALNLFNGTRSVLLAVVAAVTGVVAQASSLPVATDGWHSWTVDAVDNAPSWCCMDWRSGKSQAAVCDLDSTHYGYGNTSGADERTGRMQIYARLHGGNIERIRALSPQCPVQVASEIHDLGHVATRESIDWLRSTVLPRTAVSEDAIAAIAAHGGKDASAELVRFAAENNDFATRKDAVFWMGQLHASGSSGVIEALMFDDKLSDMRKHAAFSISQSTLATRGELLIRQGQNDSSPAVRSEAWFWLAQSGLPGSQQAIRTAIETEKNGQVREQAIFALSQLPDERGVDALVSLIEDGNLHKEERKQALFWLAESGSEKGLAYLAAILQ